MNPALLLSLLVAVQGVSGSHWADRPLPESCASGVKVQFLTQSELLSRRAAEGGAFVAGVAGDSATETCIIRIAYDLIDKQHDFCAVYEHEEGHLRGMEHVNDPRDVMYPWVAIPRDCMVAFPTKQVRVLRRLGWHCKEDWREGLWLCRKRLARPFTKLIAF